MRRTMALVLKLVSVVPIFVVGLARGHARLGRHARCSRIWLERALPFERAVHRRELARRRAVVSLELSDRELYEKLRERVESIPDPEVRRDLQENPWDGLRKRYPVSSEFEDAMREIETQKRTRRRNVRTIIAVGSLLFIAAYAALTFWQPT